MNQKLPPHDIDAEEAVIGSLLIDPDAIHKIATFLEPGDLFRESHQWVYEACLTLYQRSEAINQITVAQELARQDRLEAVGGAAHLIQLVSIVPTSLHVEYYANIVHRLAVMRRLIAAAGQIAAIGYEAGADADAALSKAEDILFRLRRGRSLRDFVSLRQVLDQYIEQLPTTRLPSEEQRLTSVPTGFKLLDEFLGGLQRSDLLILAARPSLGKTSLALGIARNAAIGHGARVAIFSLEMDRSAVAQRFVSGESGVDSRRLRLGHITAEEESRIMDATGKLAEAPIYLDDSPQLNVVEMRSKARRLHYESGIDLIIVDYLQLAQGAGRSENRVLEIGEISRSLKAMARELEVPVIAVSQLSRAVEWRASHRPQLSDLRESGSIEQDADIVMFIYREDLVTTREEWEKQPEHLGEPYPEGIATIIVAKHRNGPIGEVNLRFVPRTVKFEDLEQVGNELF